MIHSHNQTAKPKVKLNGIEYLLLSIQSNPGKSQRWHLRRKYMYQHGQKDRHNGGSGCGYFVSPSYRGVLWNDMSQKEGVRNVWYDCFSSVNESYYSPRCSGYTRRASRTKCSRLHLTPSGWDRANKARKKIGLEPLPHPV